MSHGKPVAVLWFDIAHLEIIDAGPRRTSLQQLDELGDALFRSLYVRLNRAIGTVAHPSPDIQPVRLLACPGAEEDALDLAGHAHMPRNAGHQTVEMSGASSAFMPTTL